MAKNAKEVAVKGRQTKLSKKTSEELIDIILRKDATERKLNAQIVNLKSEVNTLDNRVKNFDADMKGMCENYEIKLRKKENSRLIIIDQLSVAKVRITVLEEKVKSYKTKVCVIGLFAVLCLLGWICF